MYRRIFLFSFAMTLLAAPLSAQLGLPQVNLPPTGTVLDPVTRQALEEVEDLTGPIARQAARVADLRLQRLDRLVRQNRETMEFDARGAPARRGELLAIDADEASLTSALSLGFRVIGTEEIDGLGILVTRLAVPEGTRLAVAERQLAKAVPQLMLGADNLHFQTGLAPASALLMRSSAPPTGTPVGIIDGGAAASPGAAVQRGFARGAPRASDHGSSVLSLLNYAGVGNVRIADVYGTDKAGGNALAIAQALGWLSRSGTRIINISLVGPENPLVGRAIARAQSAGIVVVAAVGNDGPAAPPAYPASYDGVLAVTAVDRRNRALIEAGRAKHLDYAAPGADIYGRSAKGRMVKLRGTSFAAPLVAARLAAALERSANWRNQLDAEARDLGSRGHDAVFGRGLLCETCRPKR